ncbi:MAG TPA: single-stranded-DNA-specific exonuclease RecJ [Candidatus Dormibacteraeota bacterium]|nr:single-stranded-DNA-specific exonuclease RecJ [Candidatus Dormibacteraeota bacterium]
MAPAQPLLAGQLAQQLRLPPLLAQCLLNRGLSDAAIINPFLEPRLKHLADPFLLPNMQTAVERLFQAREAKEGLVIFGDYDVDGVTSTALLLEVFQALGWSVNAYLPHRMDEGYGLTDDAVDNCLEKFPTKLLLAVDCGSSSAKVIDRLKRQGVDVIVLDHHQVGSPQPEALALVNPQLSVGSNGAAAQFTELCSAGLAFKLAHALVKRGRETGLAAAADFDLRPLLDFVALGTIADIVPLSGENRILVATGLERLNRTQRPGLVALKRVAQGPPQLGTHEIGFQLAPRLNAAGRLETAEDALNLLRAKHLGDAMPLALKLDAHNRERRNIERTIATEAIAGVRSKFDPEKDFVIVEGQAPWHIGVVGIVAARVLQQFYRPTIIVGGDGGQWRGSGRSIAGFDLAAALRECGDLLLRHGGHAMAAGVTFATTNLEALRERLNEIGKRALKTEELQAPLRLDAEVGLDEITMPFLGDLNRLRPCGQGNPTVQFCSRKLTHQRPLQRMGANKQHVRMWLTDGTHSHEAVWWGAGEESLPVGHFDVAFAPQIDDYNGRRNIQLKVLDWRTAT